MVLGFILGLQKINSHFHPLLWEAIDTQEVVTYFMEFSNFSWYVFKSFQGEKQIWLFRHCLTKMHKKLNTNTRTKKKHKFSQAKDYKENENTQVK